MPASVSRTIRADIRTSMVRIYMDFIWSSQRQVGFVLRASMPSLPLNCFLPRLQAMSDHCLSSVLLVCQSVSLESEEGLRLIRTLHQYHPSSRIERWLCKDLASSRNEQDMVSRLPCVRYNRRTYTDKCSYLDIWLQCGRSLPGGGRS